MKIGILTSSRADYGILVPLLKELQSDAFFQTELIAFHTHLSNEHGYTLQYILADGFEVPHRIETLVEGDGPEMVSKAMGYTMQQFAGFWAKHSFDRVICLGDRYEMFAAVAAALPFNIPVAHIHGGETTLGAIDNAFRHSISVMSDLHFTTTEEYRKRVVDVIGSETGVYNVGALSVDNFKTIKFFSLEGFKDRFDIDLSKPTVLITFHPETVGYEKNEEYTNELILALKELKEYQLVITMPNTDTMGMMIRTKLHEFINGTSNAIGVESFGMIGYWSAMKHSAFMLGNTSSGFVDASVFPKWVINLGDRQKGRILTPNILQTVITKEAILNAVKQIKANPVAPLVEVYGKGDTASKIVSILKKNS